MTDWRWDSNLEYWLRRTQQRYAQALNHILETQFGLTERHWPVLQALFVDQGIQQTVIGERTGEPGYQTSRVLDRLEALGLVERRSDPMNHRARLVYLTQAGEQMREPLNEALSRLHQQWLEKAGIDEATLKQMFDAWLPEPVTQTSVTQTPVTQTPVTQTPVTQTPVTQTPVTQTPVTQTPATKSEAAAHILEVQE